MTFWQGRIFIMPQHGASYPNDRPLQSPCTRGVWGLRYPIPVPNRTLLHVWGLSRIGYIVRTYTYFSISRNQAKIRDKIILKYFTQKIQVRETWIVINVRGLAFKGSWRCGLNCQNWSNFQNSFLLQFCTSKSLSWMHSW